MDTIIHTSQALGPAIVGIVMAWVACRRVATPGRDLILSWDEASRRQRSIATGIGIAVGTAWAALCAYMAPTIIPVLRGRDVPWADGTLAGFLNDTATASFVTVFAVCGIGLAMTAAAAALKQLRNGKPAADRVGGLAGLAGLAVQQWLPVDPAAAQPGDIAVFDDNSTAIVAGNGQLIGPDGQLSTRNIRSILRSNIAGPPV